MEEMAKAKRKDEAVLEASLTSLAIANALLELLVENGVISDGELERKFSAQKLPYPAIFQRQERDVLLGSLREKVLSGSCPMAEAVREFERDLILSTLGKAGYNQTKAAALLGTTRGMLEYKIKKLGINRRLLKWGISRQD